MNRIFQAAVLAFALTLSGVARASEAVPPGQAWRRAMVSIDLARGGLGSISPTLEYALTDHLSVSLALEVGWSSWSAETGPVPDTKFLSFGGELGISGFFTGRAPDGLWLGARFGGNGYRIQSAPAADSTHWTATGALLVGYTRVFPSGLSVQVAVGPSIGHTRDPGDDHATSWSAALRTIAAVGFAF